jgi:GNAT superfamily N-acetyltransferase
MELRPATPADKPAMIELLRKSLGDSTIPKSESLWNWKHEQNPFGNSYVLLAVENEMLIGLRAFMKWTWKWNDKTYKAIRAVDTATHPDFQGKGIFKKLTLKQLELCKEEGVHFVFNTPNTQSMPGYLKMGWQVQGRMPIKFKVARPVALGLRVALKKTISGPPAPGHTSDWQALLKAFGSAAPPSPAGLHTPYSLSYVNWRYATNPLFAYNYLSDLENYLLLYRLKPHSKYTELRITDLYVFNHHKQIRSHLKKEISKISKMLKPDLVTVSGLQYEQHKKLLGFLGPLPVLKKGPVVTLRDINATGFFDTLMDQANWSYSTGDLELF